MRNKKRLTVTVDTESIEAGKEGRLRTLAKAIAVYQKEFGEITAAELAAQERVDRRNAIRPRRRAKRR